MNQNLGQYLPGPRSLFAALAISALAAIGSPGTASANSTANTTILNTVRVDYKDATGLNSFAANASTTVTVNLVKAPLLASGAPTGANGTPALACLPAITAASGSTINAIYALTATANGQDTYSLAMTTNTPLNLTSPSLSFNVLKFDGTLDGGAPANPNPATRVLGSAIPTRVVSAGVLEFPGGALAGFQVNDIVIVQTTAGPRAFLVTGVSVGSAASFSHIGGTAYTDATGALTAEVKGTLTLGAYANQTLSLNSANDTVIGGGGIAPAFDVLATAATLGVPVSEMILVEVSASGQTASQLDGSISYVLTTKDGAGNNPITISCTAGTFKAPTLSIKKEARNFTTGGTFGATATGNPGEILEYRVTVTNPGGQAAQVVVADAVPVYTTLTAYTGSFGGTLSVVPALSDFFARINNGTTNIDLTRDSADSEVQPLAPLAKIGFGKTGATIAAGSALTFYLGDSSTNAAGGKIPACSDTTYTTQAACTAALKTWVTTYTILYRVKID